MEKYIPPQEATPSGLSDTGETLQELAKDAGLRDVVLPKVGTEAYKRLKDLCIQYSKQVHQEMIGTANLRASQPKRRELHNQLCIMIFGLDHAAVNKRDYKDLQRVANLAHYVSGLDQYVENV